MMMTAQLRTRLRMLGYLFQDTKGQVNPQKKDPQNVDIINYSTSLGGYFTVIYGVACAFFFISSLLPYLKDNIEELRSVVPSLVSQLQLNRTSQTLKSNIEFNITFVGYNARCVSDDYTDFNASLFPAGVQPCVPDIFVALASGVTTGKKSYGCIAHYDVESSCPSPPSIYPYPRPTTYTPDLPDSQFSRGSCMVQLQCEDCILADIETLQVYMDAQGAFAFRIDWTMVSTTGIPAKFYQSQSFDDLNGAEMRAAVAGSVYPSENQIFRGLTASSVSLSVIPTLAKVPVNNFIGTGYHSQFSSFSRGSQVTTDKFYSTDFVRFHMKFVQTPTTLEIIWNEKLSAIAFISAVGGVISATFGALEFSHRIVCFLRETGKKHLSKKKKKGKGAGKRNNVQAKQRVEAQAEEPSFAPAIFPTPPSAHHSTPAYEPLSTISPFKLSPASSLAPSNPSERNIEMVQVMQVAAEGPVRRREDARQKFGPSARTGGAAEPGT
eukprot:GILI01006743.1.p1 GENE.GILI01006743.1~~GILI01006743.1.p1  ORF type:complete len:494 (+),score=93.52 GILI01006743.1:80-1561(+)